MPKEKWKLSSARHEAIVDVLSFEKARRRLAEAKSIRTGGKQAKTAHVYILSGLLRCDCCYDEMKDERRFVWVGERKRLKSGQEAFYYNCGRKNKSKYTHNCNSMPLPAKGIEEYVVSTIRKLLENPVAIYEYQKRLVSTKKEIQFLRERQKRLLNLFNALPDKEERLKEQHTLGILQSDELVEKINDLSTKKLKLTQEMRENDLKISQNVLSQGYANALEQFAQYYGKNLTKKMADCQKTSEILRMLIDEIIVYTRPITKDDKIAGNKKPNQEIPYRLRIRLKLPQDIIDEIAQTNQPVMGEYIDEKGSHPFRVESVSWSEAPIRFRASLRDNQSYTATQSQSVGVLLLQIHDRGMCHRRGTDT